MERTAKVQDLMDEFGVSKATVYNWRKKGCPANESPLRFDIFEVGAWMQSNGISGTRGKHHDGESNDAGTGKADWDTRRTAALAQTYELKLARERGTLIEKAVVEETWSRIANSIRQAWQTQASQMAARLVGMDAQEIELILQGDTEARLKELVDKALEL